MAGPELSSLTTRISVPEARAWAVANRATQLATEGRDIIHLDIGDPDMDTDEIIRSAVIDSLNRGRTHYPPLPGEPVLRREIADHTSAFYARDISPEQIIVFPGVQPALYATFQCLAEAGNEVILLQPTYATYPAVIEACGATIVNAVLDPKKGFQLDIPLIEALVTANTRAILINSPSNPSGAVFSAASMRALVKLCLEKGIWIVSDEVYAALVYDGEFASPLTSPGAEEIVVVLRSLSKSHAMSGWRLGWAIAPPRLASCLTDLSQPMLFGVSQFIQDAAVTALQHSDSIVPKQRDKFRDRRDALCRKLCKIEGFDVFKPAGGMFALVDISAFGCDGETFANELLDATGVSVVPGFAFGRAVAQCIRIGFCQEVDLLIEAAKRMADFARERRLR